MEGVAAGPAGHVERTPGRQKVGHLDQQRRGREVEMGGVGVVLIPVARHPSD
jgi:hypothetical protein